MWMVFRPGSFSRRLEIMPYDFTTLVMSIGLLELKAEDWILTSESKNYIRKNYVRMFINKRHKERVDAATESFPKAVQEYRYNFMVEKLRQHGGNVIVTCEKYAIARNTMYRTVPRHVIRQIRKETLENEDNFNSFTRDRVLNGR